MRKSKIKPIEVDPNHKPIEPLVKFETVKGATTIKTTLYPLVGDDPADFRQPWKDATRIEKEHQIAAYRADQLAPVVKRPREEYSPDDFLYSD